ncbi:hypothetical protein [Arundinibacter roseus]|uniref:hypothetical protein n=1 Tax=Arundinibacter roseus TaxID=2070510 RepID=UPI0018FEEE61|nr:hypothetical protein [Arundinibacter roseus]
MALPYRTTGSLYPGFPPARPVGLAVKPACTIALHTRLPSVLSRPLEASVTLSEATTPVKLPTMHGLRLGRIRSQASEGWYFNGGSMMPGDTTSQPPTYPTHP